MASSIFPMSPSVASTVKPSTSIGSTALEKLQMFVLVSTGDLLPALSRITSSPTRRASDANARWGLEGGDVAVPAGAEAGRQERPRTAPPHEQHEHGSHNRADDAARTQGETVVGEQAPEQPAHERADQAGDERLRPVPVAVAGPTQDQLRDPADGHPEDDQTQDQHVRSSLRHRGR